ncbi:hypothetical protein Peur_015787 [Populus x canadensis]
MVGKSYGYFYRIGREMESFLPPMECKAFNKQPTRPFICSKDARLPRRGHTPLKCVMWTCLSFLVSCLSMPCCEFFLLKICVDFQSRGWISSPRLYGGISCFVHCTCIVHTV